MNLQESFLPAVWVLIAAATVYASPVGDCPPVDPLDHTDHLPDSKNCSLFYKCDHAAPVLFECPDGLHFNPDLQVCDWPNRAGCSGGSGSGTTAAPVSSTQVPASSTAAAPSSTAAPIPSEDCPAIGTCPQYENENSIAKHLPHASNCSQFCKCDHGKPVKFDCPAGLHFNPALEVCDWPYRAGCAGASDQTQAPSSPEPTTTNEASTAAPSSAPTQAPSSSEPTTTTEAPTAAPTSAPSTTAKPTPAPSDDCPAVGTCPQYEDENSIAKHLPHASNCSQFCKCDHGKPVKFDCPAGLHFNPALEVCDWPYRAGCAGESDHTQAPSSPELTTTTEASTAAPTSVPSTTAKPTPAPSDDCPAVGTCPQYEDENSIAKHLPHASNCSQFCKCDHGKPVKFDCPAGLHFNPALEVCDWPYRAGCAGTSDQTQAPSSPEPTTTTEASTAAPTSAPTQAPSSPEPTTTTEASSAAPTSAPSTTAKPTPAPSDDCPAVGTCPQYEDENSIAKHLPHASNCSQFCKCDHGKPVKFDCPAGLHFNPALEVCDWPYRAGCAGASDQTQAPSSPEPTTTTEASTAAPSSAPTQAPSSPESTTTTESHTAAPTSAPSTTAKPTPAPSDDCPAVGTCPQYEDQNSIAKHLPHASNCSQFCKCDHGKAVKFDCPAGLHFNPALEVCDWPYRAGCAGTSDQTQAPSSPEPTTTTEASTAAPSSAPTQAPSSSEPTTTTEAPTAAPTSAPSTTAKPTPAPSDDCPAVGTCPQYEDENSIAKHLPHASNCSQFCKCDHGKPVKFDCPAGLHFNPALEVCDWPYRAGCAGTSDQTQAPSSLEPTTTTEASTAAPSSAPTQAPSSPESTTTTESPTAAPTSAPSTTAKPTPAPSDDCPAVGTCPQYEDENSIAKHLPHASNCSQFCKCDHGKPVKFDCPAGLHFNPALEVCDWPYRAGCAGESDHTQAPSSPEPTTTTEASTAAPTSVPSTTAKPTPAPSDDCPAVGTCPQYEDENSIAKHLPHASNCSQFCKCDHGKPVKFDCPAGLHFNPALEVCDWPYRAGCAGTSDQTQAPSSPEPTTTTEASTAAPTSAPTQAPSSPEPTTTTEASSAAPTSAPSTTAKPTPAPSDDCPAVGTCPQYEDENSIAKHLPHASNCSQFCKCDHGKPVKFDCPAGLHFNPALEVCDWPYRAGCAGASDQTQAPSSPEPTTTTEASTAAPSSAPTQAPSSPESTTTTESHTAAPTSAPSTTAKPTPAPSDDCPAVGTCPQYEDQNSIAKHLPHASNCSQFCKCDHGKAVKFDCPAGLHFNRALEVCDWPYRAGCAGTSDQTQAPSSPEPTTTNEASTAAPSSAPTQAPSSSEPTTTTEAPTAAPTSAPSTTAKPTPAPSDDCPAVGTCPQYEDENSIAKHLPHASNCSQFCKCDHGKPVKFDCPAGLHFNPALEVCDWPYRAGCAGESDHTQAPSSPEPTTTTEASTAAPTSVPSTTAKPTPAPSDDCPAVGTCPQYEDENSIANHLPHASNCNQFCKCDHGKPVTFDCPAGLHFNPSLEVCDWPYRAGCASGSN